MPKAASNYWTVVYRIQNLANNTEYENIAQLEK